MRQFQMAVCQLQVSNDKGENIRRAKEMLHQAAEAGSQVAVLPEMFNCPYDNSFFPAFAEEYPKGETLVMLAEAARETGLHIVGGSIPEREGERLYNTSFAFSPEGLLARHRKVHLFDVELASGLSFRESDTLGAGQDITVFDTPMGKFGVAICYDIRFPELSRLMTLQGAEVIVIPAAFNMTTGPAHWEMLLRMRAVDNQVFVVGASPARDARASYVAYGHSMVVEPWGGVIARADEREQIIYAEIDLDRVAEVRRQLPLLKHRRRDLYSLVEVPKV